MQLSTARCGNGSWPLPLHLAPKGNEDGDAVPWSNYRGVNARIISDRYPIPRIRDIVKLLRGKKIFLKIDLVRA